ncbi:MAG: hybrid sensor histidine kinase/response regulator [Candidatus Latescibacteria bacterium]|nr:hybrid sensor histidine kinase/response regulator [Candidatus Latescibacterota bacterium]
MHQGSRLLIVDDTPQNLQVLGGILREQGYKLSVAQSGAQALEVARRVLPELILLDVMMPEMDGFEVCRHLKADPATAEIPVIFLTAKTEAEDVVRGFELGAVDYVTKPFNPPELLKRVQTHLELALLRRDLEKQVEEKTSQLLQAQRLESMGQLAAGIAHEVNSPMQFIGNNTDFLSQALEELAALRRQYHQLYEQARIGGAVAPELLEKMAVALEACEVEYLDSETERALGKIQEGVKRVVEIVEGMRELAHPGGREKVAADLNHLVHSAITVCRNEWKYVADLTLDTDPGLAPVQCFPGELSQCIVNLVVNAAHAIAEAAGPGGAKGQIGVSLRPAGPWAEIRVEDNGTGIPPEVQPRIFDFLFTTKEFGKGTGQGLSLVQRVIRDHHAGEVCFETAMGKGTTFLLRLPLSQA